jgi:hypothetical protein
VASSGLAVNAKRAGTFYDALSHISSQPPDGPAVLSIHGVTEALPYVCVTIIGLDVVWHALGFVFYQLHALVAVCIFDSIIAQVGELHRSDRFKYQSGLATTRSLGQTAIVLIHQRTQFRFGECARPAAQEQARNINVNVAVNSRR